MNEANTGILHSVQDDGGGVWAGYVPPMRDGTAHEWGTQAEWTDLYCGPTALGYFFGGCYLGLRPRLVWDGPLALYGDVDPVS